MRIKGHHPSTPVLAGTESRVLVDDQESGTFTCVPGQEFMLEFDLPPGLGSKPFVNVKVISEDYVLTGKDRRFTTSLFLESLAIIP